MNASATITYLGHSGFAVETSDHFLVFDYFLDDPLDGGLGDGVISPKELPQKDTIAFVSHSHHDHFNRRIFDWRREISGIGYVLSDDISRVPGEDILWASPEKEYPFHGMRISTLTSTDMGVAFVVEVDGLRLYHAGDLNWWHWIGEPDEDNERMKCRYQQEVGRLKGIPIDVAFVPLDPRQEENYLLGLDYLLRHVQVDKAIPMHFWGILRCFTGWLTIRAQRNIAPTLSPCAGAGYSTAIGKRPDLDIPRYLTKRSCAWKENHFQAQLLFHSILFSPDSSRHSSR